MAKGIFNVVADKIFPTIAPGSNQTENNSPRTLLFSQPITRGDADTALNHITGQLVARQKPTSQTAAVNRDSGDNQKTVTDFLREIQNSQPFDEAALSKKKEHVELKLSKPPEKLSVADYDAATWRAVFNKAGYSLLTDAEIGMAVQAMKNTGYKSTNDGFSLSNLRRFDALPGPMFVGTDMATIEKAKQAGQAVLQYQEYKARGIDAAVKKGQNYVTEALGGFMQPVVNAPINIFNGISEPFRAGERLSFGTKYIPEIPRMQVAERSEYWNKDGRMIANQGAEITSTIVFGGAAGSKAIGTQAGRVFLGTESAYNIGAGILGQDVTQTDEQGNARQMPIWERGLRVTGGIFGARQTINTEIATPNSITNRAVDKLDDIFKKPPTFKPQGELVTPEGFRIKTGTNPSEVDGIEKAGNTFEMRAKKTLSGIAPEEQVVNALKTEFKPIDYKFGNNTIKLSRTGMKHILQRHHPEFWSGTVKDKQSYFAAKTTIEELQNVITSVLKQNRETLTRRGAVRMFQVKGNVDGVEYTLGIERGQVKQLYSPKK